MWLDAGIVPFSRSAGGTSRGSRGYATGASRGSRGPTCPTTCTGSSGSPPTGSRRCASRSGCGSTRSSSCPSRSWGAPFRQVLGYEKMLASAAARCTGRGERDRGGGRSTAWARRHALAVLCAAARLEPASATGRRTRSSASCSPGHLVRFFVDYANIAGFRPYGDLGLGPATGRRLTAGRGPQPLLVREATRGTSPLAGRVLDEYEAYLDDLSNWYIRRSRRRFGHDEAALRTLWWALVQSTRVLVTTPPFLAEHLWLNLVAGAADDAPDSVFLASWPEPAEPDSRLLDEVADVRRCRRAGAQRARSRCKQPLRRLVVQGASLAEGHRAGDRGRAPREGGRVRPRRGGRARVKPNLPVLGPKSGRSWALSVPLSRPATSSRWTAGASAWPVTSSAPTRCSSSAAPARAGRSLRTTATPSPCPPRWTTIYCARRVLDLIHRVNTMRREEGAGADRPDHPPPAGGSSRADGARRVDRARGSPCGSSSMDRWPSLSSSADPDG